MPKSDQKNEIYIGMALIGTTGLLIGLVMDSPLLMVIATFLGLMVGGFVGWLGGFRYMVIICVGVLVGAYFGYCLLYTSPSPRDRQKSRMPSSA